MGSKRDKMGVRLAQLKDIKEIQKLGNIFRFMFTSEIIGEIKKKLIFVYEKEGEITGFIVYNAKKNSIRDLIVSKDYRRQGIGEKLFKTTVALLNIHYLDIWATLSPENSVEFWKKMGFQEIPTIKITKRGNKLKRMIWKR